MPTPSFPDIARFDALQKVRGEPIYGADVPQPGLLHAMLVPARIALGTMTALPLEEASAVPGVVRILTPDDFPEPAAQIGYLPPFETLTREIAYRGQPVALVVAETLEAAIEAAEAIDPVFETRPFSVQMDSEGAERDAVADFVAGDAMAALEGAATVIDAVYESPTQHHNPMELLSTTAVWEDGRLTVYEGSQSAGSLRGVLAAILRIDPASIVVKSPYIGGAFGQRGGLPQRQTAIVARAAMLTGRPVKLVTPRSQIFHLAIYRPRSRHRIRLGADATGRMIAVRYDVEQEQSRRGIFPVAEYHDAEAHRYAIANYLGSASDLRIDRQHPGWMRAPHPHPASFAFESAIDELAVALDRDPVALRLEHEATSDPVTGKPVSSHHLNACLTEGARRFGWSARSAAPGSMTASDGALIGWGVACGNYPSMMSPSITTLRVRADGSATISLSGHEMGQGIRTAIANAVLAHLDVDPARLEILIGDTSAAPQHITAGSWGSAGAVPAAEAAARRMRERLDELAGERSVGGNAHQRLATLRRPSLEVQIDQLAPGQDASALGALRQGGFAIAGPEYPEFVTFSTIAHFVEVRIEPRTRRIRVPRVVSIADCGRVVSPRTARSQVEGGVTWAIGAALREETEVDARYGGYLNCDIAEYAIAVNADIGEIDVGFIDEPDPLANATGLKGLGEVAMVGASAAISNAVFHATGRRIREMPIRVEHLL